MTLYTNFVPRGGRDWERFLGEKNVGEIGKLRRENRFGENFERRRKIGNVEKRIE